MAGFRTFATGEVLTAANVNNFLMKQSVMVFDDATARTAALGTDVVEGMLTYNKADEELQVFDGAAFVSAAGGLVAVKSAIFTGIQSASVGGGANVAVTDLTITHEVADVGNRLIISAYVGASSSSSGVVGSGIAVAEDGVLLNIGNADGLRTRTTAGGGFISVSGSPEDRLARSLAFRTIHTPGAGEKVYTVRIINVNISTRTIHVNRMESDGTNNEQRPRSTSGLMIEEVRV